HGRDGPWNQPLRIGCFPAIGRLQAWSDQRKERESRYAELQARLGVRQQPVHRIALDTGHGGNRLGAACPIYHEHRIDEIVRAEPALARETPREAVATHPAHAAAWKFAQYP